MGTFNLSGGKKFSLEIYFMRKVKNIVSFSNYRVLNGIWDFFVFVLYVLVFILSLFCCKHV